MAQDQARNEDFRLLRSGLPERTARAREARLRRDFCLTRDRAAAACAPSGRSLAQPSSTRSSGAGGLTGAWLTASSAF